MSAVLVATCDNEIDQPDLTFVRCYGELRFYWGYSQAKCDTCGAWCGISVASWTRVEML